MLRRLVVASLLIASGCSDESAVRAPSLALRNADGTAPDLSGIVSASLHYRLEAFGAEVETVRSDVVGGEFDLGFSVDDAETPVWMRIELEDVGGVRLVGGTPAVTSGEGSSLDVILGAPGTCVVVPELALATPRDSAAAVVQGRYVLVAGGIEDAGPSARVDRLDLVSLGRVSLPDTASPLGATRGTPIDRNRALILPSSGPAFVQDVHATDATLGRRFPTLHEGASTAPGIATLPASGGIVVGGGDALAPSDRISFVIPTNEYVFELRLREATLDRAVGAGTAGLWVLSHEGTTASMVQIQTTTSELKLRIAGIPDGERHGAHLFVEPSGMRMLLLGGTDENGDLRSDTLRLGGCPVSCGSFAGPTWTGARREATFDPSGFLVGGEGPSAVVERLRYPVGNEAFIESFATLVIPRRSPAVAALPSGPILVMGGIGASGRVAETEICFPPD